MGIPKDVDLPALEKIRVLNGAHLKWIAIVSMLIDHFNKGIMFFLLMDYPDSMALSVTSSVFDVLGRFAFPIFLFQLVEGVHHTSSKPKYLRNLLVFAVLAEIPYDLFETGSWLSPNSQNMFFTLALAMVTLWAIDEIRKRLTHAWVPLAILIGLASSFVSAFLGLDYSYYGILVPVVLYLFYDRRLLGSALSYLIVIKELWSFVGFIVLNLYNGERGKFNKWFAYWFYPVHLLIIGLVRVFVIKA